MKKWIFFLVTLFMAVFLVSGCNNTNETNEEKREVASEVEENEQSQNVEEENQSNEEEEALFPLSLTDALGNEVTIQEKPNRIVTLIPSITETVFALNQGELVVGRTDWCNYPEQVFEIESVGGMQFDIEKILSLKPDVILTHASGADSSAEGLEQLRNAGITVVVINDAQTLDDVLTSIEMIGEVLGVNEEAKQITSDMKNKFSEIKEKAASINEEELMRVWVEVAPAPEIYTTGQGTFMHEMLEIINAENVAGDLEGWIKFTEEDAVSFNPDVIITTYGYYLENPEEQVKSRQGWQEVSAVKNDRVFDVHSDKVTRSGPRLSEGVEELAKSIYPEVFGK